MSYGENSLITWKTLRVLKLWHSVLQNLSFWSENAPKSLAASWCFAPDPTRSRSSPRSTHAVGEDGEEGRERWIFLQSRSVPWLRHCSGKLQLYWSVGSLILIQKCTKIDGDWGSAPDHNNSLSHSTHCWRGRERWICLQSQFLGRNWVKFTLFVLRRENEITNFWESGRIEIR